MSKQPPDPRDPNDILAELRSAEAARQAEREARYEKLVSETAAGRADAKRLGEELAALNVPGDVFAAHVKKRRRRHELVRKLAAAREAARQREELRPRLEAAEAEGEEIRRRHDREKVAPIREEMERLRDIASDEREIRAELRRDAGAELVARAEDLARQRDRAAASARQLREAAESWRPAVERGEQNAAAQLRKLEAQLADAEKLLQELTRQAAEAEAALLAAVPLTPSDGSEGTGAKPPGSWGP